MNFLKRLVRGGFERLESGLDAVCGPRLNPLVQLGALGWLLFWLIAISGIYLYIFFDTGVTQAYASVEDLTHKQWWAGGILRSIHRYASDGLVVVTFVHMLREFGMDRLRGVRWFAWVTGLLLIGFIYVCGITGYWMVWDQLAQYVALTTSRWLDALPIFAEPISRNFVNNAGLSGRFFSLMAFVHIAAPLLMLLFMWVHIQRYSHARVYPARNLTIATVVALLALSLVEPALSQGAANLDEIAASVGLDWFYLAFYPLMDAVGPGGLWALSLGFLLVMVILPWAPPLQRPAPAVVHLDNCNGCARCFDDCPYSAITMQPRSDGAAFSQEAVVDPDLCVSCGICAGACPTATPFRRATALVPGIELPEHGIAALRERVTSACQGLAGKPGVLVFRCEHGADVAQPSTGAAAVIDVPCAGMVPPSFIDLVITRHMASGVMLAGCHETGCYQRLGTEWTSRRVAATRDPYLRQRIPRERVALSWASSVQQDARSAAVEQFVASLGGLAEVAPHRPVPAAGQLQAAWQAPARRWPGWLRWPLQALLLAGAMWPLGFLSARPEVVLRGENEAVVTLTFSHAGRPLQECRKQTPEELAKLPPNMRRPVDCARGRWPVYIELELDGRQVFAGTEEPAGLWNDGPSSLFERFPVPAGPRQAVVRLRDSGRESGFDYSATASLDLRPGQNLVVEFRQPGGFTFR